MKASGDGNFHLQRRHNRSKETNADSLIGDAGFWAVEHDFQQYIEATDSIPDTTGRVSNFILHPSDANPFSVKDKLCPTQAGDPIRATTAAKLAVTGVYGVSCRHGCLLPNGVIDFHKGKR